ncbi:MULTISPECIES: S41 family peptidase [unclassified Aureispira]|uniref:S41 family peptidase n=1 Tax=unclassified Aureispira TaxID=2649989 RepID=UPI0007C86EF8|nr:MULTISPECIES: S41 family peptidase [unclassified Aureispira]WMX13665.1 S41 family peptidase [Aureispira sp. CCB-E]
MNLIHQFKNKIVLSLIMVFGLLGISTELNDFEIAKNLEIFSNIYRELNTFYVDEVDPEHLMETGVNAMLNSLDPYTTYIPADEVAQFRSTITGKYGGVGASILKGKEHIIISLPYENGPAQKAGLKVGDKMLEINGRSVVGASMRDISTQMRGVPNSEVTIKVAREGVAKPLSFTLTREEINVTNTPYYGMLEDNTAYIVLNSFSENAGKNVANALTTLKENHEVKGVILDLRGNTGGLLTEAVNVANVFLDKGSMVVQIKGRDKATQQVFRTLNNPIDNEIPVCVLIDRSSASASEIVAGAIQDLDRGVIVGQRSYGKGLVQNTRNLSFGAKIKLTTARYYIPSGRCIQALRYKNGKPEQIPDSLQASYETMGGRTVYAGGGIKPDVFVDNTAFLKIMSTLNKDLYLFDFAAAYELKNKTIAKPSEFELTDEDFEAFLMFLKERGYVYKTETEMLLEQLETKAEKEAYAQVLASELEDIKEVLSTSGEEELRKQKGRLMHLLQRYIVTRYYYEKGSLETGVRLDEEIKAAQTMLADKTIYEQILTPAK